MLIKAFSGLIPAADKVESVAAVPYDVVNREEAAMLAKGNPESLLNLSRAEIGFSPITDPYSEEVYQKYQNNTYSHINAHLLDTTYPALRGLPLTSSIKNIEEYHREARIN